MYKMSLEIRVINHSLHFHIWNVGTYLIGCLLLHVDYWFMIHEIKVSSHHDRQLCTFYCICFFSFANEKTEER